MLLQTDVELNMETFHDKRLQITFLLFTISNIPNLIVYKRC